MFQFLQAFSRPRKAAGRGPENRLNSWLIKTILVLQYFSKKTIDLSKISFAILLYVTVLSAILLKYCYGNTKNYGIFQQIQSEPYLVNLDV